MARQLMIGAVDHRVVEAGMGDAGLEIVGHQFRHDTVKVAEQADMAGQPVLGGLGPGRFGIAVAGERQAGDEDAVFCQISGQLAGRDVDG